MELRTDGPHTRVYAKDGSWWALPLDSFAPFVAEWTGREAFWQGVDIFDMPLAIKLGDIASVSQHTAEVIAALRAEEQESRQRQVIDG